MRRLLAATTILALSSSLAFAQDAKAPVFKPVSDVPGMTLTKPAQATAPAAAPAEKAPAAAPAAAAAPAEKAPATAAEAPKATSAEPAASGNADHLPVSRSGQTIDSYGAGAIPALPIEAVTENGITYLSGGISDEEKDQLKSQEASYNTRLQITGLSGEYVSDVSFTLRNGKNVVLLTVSDAGPYLYMQLPAGSYSAEFSANGKPSKKVELKVPAKGAIKSQVRI